MLQSCLKNKYESDTSNRSSTRPVFEKVSHPNENLGTDPGRRDESHPLPSLWFRPCVCTGIDVFVMGYWARLVPNRGGTAPGCIVPRGVVSRRGGGLQVRNPEIDDPAL